MALFVFVRHILDTAGYHTIIPANEFDTLMLFPSF